MCEHPEYRGLLDDVVANPGDYAPRLVMADWLEDHSQPERAEFIRVQIAMENLRAGCVCGTCVNRRGGAQQHHNGKCVLDYSENRHLRVREQELFSLRQSPPKDNAYMADRWADVPGWLAVTHCGVGPFWMYPQFPPYGYSLGFEFRAGFVEVIERDLSAWLEHDLTLLKYHPVREARATGKEPIVDRDYSAYWEPGLQYAEKHQVPFEFGAAADWKASFRGGLMIYRFRSRIAALKAMSDALLKIARQRLAT